MSSLEIMSRPWWLYRGHGRVPASVIHKSEPRPVTEFDIALCERLIAAFTVSTQQRQSHDEAHGLWGWIVDTHHTRLVEALESGDPRELARLLASMFQSEFVWGMSGLLVDGSYSALGLRIYGLSALDLLVSLGEALGVVTIDNPEQGRAARAFDDGLAGLVARIESALGFQIASPAIGAPFGLYVDGRIIARETPEQVYAAVRLTQALEIHLPGRSSDDIDVVEIGGGYGAVCHWFLKMRPSLRSYVIVDLPLVNVLQGYFLTQAFGSTEVSFQGERRARIAIVPDWALGEVETPFDALVNKDSMPEMPREAMLGYLEWAATGCAGFFYSYNQEAESEFDGRRQGVVSREVERLGGFDRVRRENSWLRRGYAEEVYVPRSGAMSAAAPGGGTTARS